MKFSSVFLIAVLSALAFASSTSAQTTDCSTLQEVPCFDDANCAWEYVYNGPSYCRDIGCRDYDEFQCESVTDEFGSSVCQYSYAATTCTDIGTDPTCEDYPLENCPATCSSHVDVSVCITPGAESSVSCYNAYTLDGCNYLVDCTWSNSEVTPGEGVCHEPDDVVCSILEQTSCETESACAWQYGFCDEAALTPDYTPDGSGDPLIDLLYSTDFVDPFAEVITTDFVNPFADIVSTEFVNPFAELLTTAFVNPFAETVTTTFTDPFAETVTTTFSNPFAETVTTTTAAAQTQPNAALGSSATSAVLIGAVAVCCVLFVVLITLLAVKRSNKKRVRIASIHSDASDDDLIAYDEVFEPEVADAVTEVEEDEDEVPTRIAWRSSQIFGNTFA